MPSGPVAVRLRLLRLLWCHEFPLERNRLLLSSKNPSLSKWGHFRSLARDCLATLPKGDMKAEIARNNPGLYCLLWTSQLQQVFNLMWWSSSMQPINFTVTALIPCGRRSNQFGDPVQILNWFLPRKWGCLLVWPEVRLGSLIKPVSTVYFIFS